MKYFVATIALLAASSAAAQNYYGYPRNGYSSAPTQGTQYFQDSSGRTGQSTTLGHTTYTQYDDGESSISTHLGPDPVPVPTFRGHCTTAIVEGRVFSNCD